SADQRELDRAPHPPVALLGLPLADQRPVAGQTARSGFGARFRTAVVRLSGAYRVSRRGVSELARELFGARLSLGTIDAICQRASEALAGPHLQLQDWVLDQDAVHV